MLILIRQLVFIAAIGVKTIQITWKIPSSLLADRHHRRVLQQQGQNTLPFSVSMSTTMGMASGLTEFYILNRLEVLFIIKAGQISGGVLLLM